MKATHFIAPLVALCGSGAWIYSQQAPLSDLEEQTRILQDRITEVKSLRNNSSDSQRKGSPGKKKSSDDQFLLADGSLDWKAIAKLMKKNRGGMNQDMRLMMRLQQKMMEMTADDIKENITKIRALDLTEDLRSELESSLVMMLAQKDPEGALSLVSDSLGKKSGQQSWQMKH
jgi:hypothetical protein